MPKLSVTYINDTRTLTCAPDQVIGQIFPASGFPLEQPCAGGFNRSNYFNPNSWRKRSLTCVCKAGDNSPSSRMSTDFVTVINRCS